ncbi:MAG: 2-hydroxyacid dehydrogenase [Chitinophagales bacterium]|nr:2-hydroxyacid dehydrogenase [Chitinophagales bacterium]MDW8427931.1 2-hydroxyacid dehydrogenase [Chitinophagales bacterium]
MKALVYSTHGFDRPFLEAAANGHELTFTEQPLDAQTVSLAHGFDAVLLFTSDHAPADVLQKLHAAGVRYLSLRSAGFDHVDLEAAYRLGLRVANVPAYSPYAVAEHAVMLLLALSRKLQRSIQLSLQNDFRLDELVGWELHQKTIGIVGTGSIGSAFARIMAGFGCRLLATDLVVNAELQLQLKITYVDFYDLCRSADVISLHCPLTPATRYLFSAPVFRQCRRGVVLINTARGAIVNTADLLDALDDGQVSAAGLDVYEHERGLFFCDYSHRPIRDALFERLRSHPRVLLTCHQAFLTREALESMARLSIDNLTQWETTDSCVRELTPQAMS